MTLYSNLTENNLIYPRQSGFQKNHSTDTALIRIIDELLFSLDKNRVSGMVLADYCKAFDMIIWFLLMTCRFMLACVSRRPPPSEKNWEFFLREVGTSEHRLLHVSSSEIDLYADDVKITSSTDCGSMGRLQESLNTSLLQVFNWALANRLPLS